jgi:hypothetical protein
MPEKQCSADGNLRSSQSGLSSYMAVFAVAMLTASVIVTFSTEMAYAARVTEIDTPAAAQQQTETPDEGYEIARDKMRPLLPGYRFAGVCTTLADGKFQNSTFRFVPLVKHGIHAQGLLKRTCSSNRFRLAWPPGQSSKSIQKVDSFSEQVVYVVPVRGQMSFQKSVFNHVCNKQTAAKRQMRKRYGIDCQYHSWNLFSIRADEMRPEADPNWLRDLLVSRRPKNLVFYDYLKLGQLTDPLCRNKFDWAGTKQINSAEAQGYKDYWSALGNASAFSINQRWDNMYKKLQAYSCMIYHTTDVS